MSLAPDADLVEKVARAMTLAHYMDRLKLPADAPSVDMNAKANWTMFLKEAQAAITALSGQTPSVDVDEVKVKQVAQAISEARNAETTEGLQYVLIRGHSAMGFANPIQASINLANDAARAALDATGGR